MTEAESCESVGTRHKISAALKGRQRSESSTAKMIATKARRTAAEGHYYKSKIPGREGSKKAAVPEMTDSQPSPLVFASTDAAFAEMMELRFKIGAWTRTFQAKHGREPAEGELAEDSAKQETLSRYAAVLQYLRQEE